MPSIEITTEQAARLAAGEDITVAPPEPLKHLIAVRHNTGAVYEIVDAKRNEFRYTGRWRLLRYSGGRLGGSEGLMRHQGGFPHDKYTFVEIG